MINFLRQETHLKIKFESIIAQLKTIFTKLTSSVCPETKIVTNENKKINDNFIFMEK